MKTIKKTKKTIETSLEANLMKEPMSALFFLKLIEIDCDFFWQELKTQAKSLNDFVYFQISLFDFFCGLCPLDFVFFVFLIRKNKLWGIQTNYNQFLSPKICFFLIKNKKKTKSRGHKPQKKSNKLIWK